MLSQNLASVNAKLTELHIKLLELDAKRKMIERARNNIADKETLPEIREKETIAEAPRLVTSSSRRSTPISRRSTVPSTRKMKALTGQMETRAQGLRAGDRRGPGHVREVVPGAASTTSARSRRLMEQQKKEAIELSKIEVEYKPLQRASEQNAKMYGIIASRQKEIDITGPMKTNNVRVLERAIVPGVPVRPKPVQNLLLGLLLGLGTGIGLAFAIEALDNTLKTQADVEQFLGVPVLGLVPIIGAAPGGEASQAGDNLRERDLGVFLDPKSVAAECCRSIRTNILFMSPDRPLQDDGRHQPEPAGGQDDDRDQPRRHDGRGGRARADRRHRHATSAPPPLVRRAEPDRDLDRDRRQGDARGGDQADRRPEPRRADLRAGSAQSVRAPAHRSIRRRAGRLRQALRPDHPRLAADVGGHRSRRARATSPTASCWSIKAGETTRESAMHARRQLAAAKARLFGVVVNAIDFSNPAYGYEYYYRNYYRYGYTYGNGPDQKATS